MNKPLLCLLAGSSVISASADSLERKFIQPPEAAKPRYCWHWMDGQISKEGITRVHEAMQRIGLGEGYIGVITGQSGSPLENVFVMIKTVQQILNSATV